MIKLAILMNYLAQRKVPLDIIKTAARNAKYIRKADIEDYAKKVVKDYRGGTLC